MSSIQAYLVIDQHRICAELSIRSDDGWQTTSFESRDDIVPLEVLNCDLALSQVYRGIKFEEQSD